MIARGNHRQRLSLNSSHKSWNPLNKRFPRLFFLLCYYFATNRNYSISHRLVANLINDDFADIVCKMLNNFSLRHRDYFSGCWFFWHGTIWKSCIGVCCIRSNGTTCHITIIGNSHSFEQWISHRRLWCWCNTNCCCKLFQIADKLLLFMWKQMGVSIQCCGYFFVPKPVSED